MGNRSRGAVLVVSAVLLMGACSGDDDGDGDTTVITDPVETSETTESTTWSTSSTTSTTADPDAAVKAEVEEAYLAQWDAYVEILSSPNPENPKLAHHFTGQSLQAMLDGISAMVLDGRALREPENPENFVVDVLSVEVDGQVAHLKACVVDGLVQVVRATDEVVNDNVVTVRYDAELRHEGKRWKLARHVIESKTDGASCDG